MPQLVMFDLDNTLARSKEPLTREMAILFAKLSQKTRVAVISGGKLEQLETQVVHQLPPTAELENIFLLPTSGGALYTYEDGEAVCVYEEVLTLDEVDAIEEAIEHAVKESGIVDMNAKSYGECIEHRGSQVTFSALGQQAPISEKEAWDPENVKRPKLRNAIAKLLPEYDVKVGGSTSIDVTKLGVNKAYGVKKIGEYLQIRIPSMLYVGDALYKGGNDEIVKTTKIPTQAVKSPAETEVVLQKLVEKAPAMILAATPVVAPSAAVKATAAASKSQRASLLATLGESFKGDVAVSKEEMKKYSVDTSLFSRTPSLVVYPKNAEDVVTLVKTIRAAKEQSVAHGETQNISITGRSAGTDMSGGPLTTSVVAVFMRYMNNVLQITTDENGGEAITEPGVFYRDFEKLTLAKKVRGEGLILPSYPASRELCAMGGIVNNNSGGERTLEYGKTENYIEEVEVVLSDGTLTTFKALTPDELEQKKRMQTFEGEIYRKMHSLLTTNAETITNAKPKVSKNSAGYALWNVIDQKTGTFNLAKLVCGAQGTLTLMTKAKLRLIRDKNHRAMLVIFLSDLNILPKIVHTVLPFNPESFESYDDNTFKLAVRFLPQMLSQMGLARAIRLGISFLPEVAMAATGGIPKLILMAEFAGETAEDAVDRAEKAKKAIQDAHMTYLPMSVKRNEHESEKYWVVRRESFALLRKSIQGMYASPFIDDFVVPPDSYPQFLPELDALLSPYDKDKSFIYTIAGHIGNGNFHLIPLMDLKKPRSRKVVLELAPKVYDLVLKYGGTTTGEHNDGIIRTPYLTMLFGEKMYSLFEETKKIFDPLGIFNPGKKVGGTFADIEHDMLKSS
jgi:HAD superfamily hydrolase (TIGR01484 family)